MTNHEHINKHEKTMNKINMKNNLNENNKNKQVTTNKNIKHNETHNNLFVLQQQKQQLKQQHK